MMQILITLSFFVGVALSCCNNQNSSIQPGLYKMEKVELHKGGSLKKILDTDCQYWKFNTNNSGIKIFNTQQVQNVLHIKMSKDSFSSYDSNGAVKDQYIIRKINGQKLELSSTQKVDQDNYYIFYFLEKVDDDTAGSSEEDFQ